MKLFGQRAIALAALAIVVAVLGFSYGTVFQRAEADPAEAAAKSHTIAVFLTSRDDGCFVTARAQAIQYFIDRRLTEINASAEFRGHRFHAVYYNNMGRDDLSVTQMREALQEPGLVGMVGPSGANRAKQVFDELGKEIAASNVPVFSAITVNTVFGKFPNVFTMRASQDDERLPVLARFLADRKFLKPALVGSSDSITSASFATGLAAQVGAPPLAGTHLIEIKKQRFEPGRVSQIAETLREQANDVILVALPGDARIQFLTEAKAAGVDVPVVFLAGDEKTLSDKVAQAYPSDLFLLTWDFMPDISRNRMREAMALSPNDAWIFNDTPNGAAPGWQTGKCTADGADAVADNALDSGNLTNLTRAMQYADMAGLIAELVKTEASDDSDEVQKQARLERLKSDYAAGVGVYRGAFENWSFRPQSRSASRLPAILYRPRGTTQVQLAPSQFARGRADQLITIHTLYMDIDLVRIFRVDDGEKSFFAEFYMASRSDAPVVASDIEFANAFVDATRSGSQVTITPISDGKPGGAYPEGLNIVKVTGKFMMSPNLSSYPFDTQLFTIELRPRSGNNAFLVQPPPERLRNRQSDTDGWITLSQYVAFDEDIIPIIDARNGERSVVPFYTANFSWILKRETTDYFLRVVVPLIFILVVAYLSIFIPREHFEAIVTIQVTALLSAVALYLSIPQVGSDDATVSDRIFLFDYLAVSLMIIISIMRVNGNVRSHNAIDRALMALHITGIPLLCAAMALYVLSMESGEVWSWQVALPWLTG